MREIERESVCECVCEREREKERERDDARGGVRWETNQYTERKERHEIRMEGAEECTG